MADASILAPQQHKQPSRKGKKAWRKNVDVTEVQAGLEEVREQVIKHGGVIAEKASDELFAVDTTGSAAIQKSYARGNKVLKADEILAQRSAVPALAGHKRAAEVTLALKDAKRRKDHVSGKDYERLRKIAYGGDQTQKDVVKAGGDAEYDPWGDDQPVQEVQYSFLEKKKPIREPSTLKRAPLSMERTGKELKAVPKPERGKSYNPVFENWQALVQREGDKAVAEEMARLEEERLEEEKQALIAKAQAEEDRDQWESEWESEWEGIMSEREDNGEDKEWLKKKRPERKTPSERNKVKRRKIEERRKIHEEKMRTREQDIARVKAFAKEADKKLAEKQQIVSAFPDSDASSSEGEEVQLRRRNRQGKAAVPDAPLEVVLADELEESLRRLKPEGNLLHDRFRSMIMRGKIESRAKITQPKKPKRELMDKWSYKDWKLPNRVDN